MKIIDIGICVNNIDPKGIGRIRCIRYNDYVGEKEKSIEYTEWSDYDPFVALPFLPSNINFIPEIGQAVKVINYNTDKETVNQEYIAGPFTTMYDFNSQNFTQQLENTTYGVAIKHKDDIRKDTGEYIDNKTSNAFAKETDFGVYGKFGSDLLFTENGLQLRGGKLKNKQNITPGERTKLISFPIMSNKSSNLYLKKFPQRGVLRSEVVRETKTDVTNLNHIIEYKFTNLSGTTTDINFYVYKVTNPYGLTFKTNNFTQDTPLDYNSLKLINLDGTQSNTGSTGTPTFVISGVSLNDCPTEVVQNITDIHNNTLNAINSLYTKEDLHPFYFRYYTSNTTSLNNTEITNKNSILNDIKITSSGPFSFGLVWSLLKINVVSKNIDTQKNVFKIENGSPEQTFAALKSDKIYLLSTETNETDKPINFDSLDKYELTQEDYIGKIDPNTYSIVRGENLIKVLKSLVKVVFSHRHNINKSIASQTDYADGQELQRLIETLENDILNKSIKIN